MNTLYRILFFSFLIFSSSAKAQELTLKPCDAELTNYQYPYPVQFITLNIQGEVLKMSFMDVKPVNANGHIVMLLHGKNFNGSYWESTAKRLTESGYRVIIPDQIGFGKSSKPQHIQYTFQLLCQNTKAILDELGIQKVAVVGHSMGGMVAARFSLMFPEMVEKLILENPIGLEDWKLSMPYLSVNAWYQRELKQDYDSLKKYQRENYFHGTWKPEYNKWLDVPAGWTISKDYPRIAWNAALTYDMIFTQPVYYELGNIKVPALLIIGQLDRTAIKTDPGNEQQNKNLGNYPELGKAAHEKIKASKLVEIDGVGHAPHIEAFEKFIEPLLQFLRS